MPSPFPGMDPYIESWIWEDFHARLIPAIYDRINPSLPKRYIASTELYIRRVNPADEERLIVGGPDLHIADLGPSTSGAALGTVAAPVNTVEPGVEQKRRYIKIVDHEERRVVTVIEVLSPSNKTRGDDGRAYRLKREEYLASTISLVEIDLLRNGQRPSLGQPVPSIGDYYILVHRSWQKGRFAIWPFSIRESIPPVRVPLDEDAPELVFDLRACIDHVYDYGRYGEQLGYDKALRPPLGEADEEWVRELLALRTIPS